MSRADRRTEEMIDEYTGGGSRDTWEGNDPREFFPSRSIDVGVFRLGNSFALRQQVPPKRS
jgi:hypothetical protein